MLFTKDRPKTHQKQTNLSAEQAHRLWEKTRSIYNIINQLNYFGNYTHDIDFQLVIKNMNEIFQNQVNIFEKQLKKYSIKSPEPSKRDIEAIGNAEVVEDRLTARFIYSSLQHLLSECILSLQDFFLNDNLRELIYKLTKEDIDLFESYIDYIMTKGWLEEPPLYKSLKNAEKRVATNEIWHLWKLLDNRYLSKQQTKYYILSVTDKDFQLVLRTGMEIVEKQINKLEEILLYYGVNLPERFPENIPTPESQEQFTDKYIFKVLYMAMINAIVLEGFSIEELVINTDVRNMVKGFIFEELDTINNLIKYGKIKGWVPLEPQFRSN